MENEILTASECIVKHGLNWQVEKRRVFVDSAANHEDYAAIVRQDNGHIFQIAKKGYNPVQNTEAFQNFDRITGTGQAKYERAGTFKQGAVVWIQARIPMEFDVVKNDRVDTFLTMLNSHDGSYPISIYPTTIRIVCQNTLQAGYASAVKKVSAKHTLNVESRFVFNAMEVMAAERAYFLSFADKCKELARREMVQSEINTFLEKLFNAKGGEEDSQRLKNQIVDINALHEAGTGANIPGVKGTAWGVYNAVTEYIDSYRSTKGDMDNRVYSSWLGSGAQLREKAFSLLLA